jgi:hypothetical protein
MKFVIFVFHSLNVELSTATAFISPSLTPIVAGTTSTNPGLRIYSYQAGKSAFLDYDQVKLLFRKQLEQQSSY